jgi:hypothetical protein
MPRETLIEGYKWVNLENLKTKYDIMILAECMLKLEGGVLAPVIFLKYGKNDDLNSK